MIGFHADLTISPFYCLSALHMDFFNKNISLAGMLISEKFRITDCFSSLRERVQGT